MPIKSHITDPSTGQKAQVVNDGELLVSQVTSPPMLPQKCEVFRQAFTDDGKSSGSSDMLVDGSATPIPFWIPADDDNDRYITSINIIVSDDASKLKYFGATNVLTNGCQLFYTRSDGTIVVIHDAIKTSWDLMRMGLLESPLVEIKPAKDITAKVDAFVSVIDFTKVLPPYGIKLDKGTNQKLTFRIHDDLTAANMPDEVDAVAYGFERFE